MTGESLVYQGTIYYLLILEIRELKSPIASIKE